MKKILVLFSFLLMALFLKAQDTGYATYYGRRTNNKKQQVAFSIEKIVWFALIAPILLAHCLKSET